MTGELYGFFILFAAGFSCGAALEAIKIVAGLFAFKKTDRFIGALYVFIALPVFIFAIRSVGWCGLRCDFEKPS